MAKQRKKMHKCGIEECSRQTINVVCPPCKQYVKHAAQQPHRWRLAMQSRYRRLQQRLVRVDKPGSNVVQLRRAGNA